MDDHVWSSDETLDYLGEKYGEDEPAAQGRRSVTLTPDQMVEERPVLQPFYGLTGVGWLALEERLTGDEETVVFIGKDA